MKTADLQELKLSISEEVTAVLDELVAVRRHLHAHPEPANEEHRTQSYVLERLEASGITARKLGDTGVVGLIEGQKPGPVLLLRADMDALPIQEENDIPYRSITDGMMHACGHDAHLAQLLIAADIMARRGLECGKVKLLFQPAEEGSGGARKMIEAGVLDDPTVDAALAFHVWSGLPIGQIAAVDGPVMAGLIGFEMTVTGKGTHAAMPEQGADPVAATAQIITTAQALVTRTVSPVDSAVLSFTAIHGGEAFNVIPEFVEVQGTIRAFDDGVLLRLRDGLEKLARGIGRALGVEVGFEYFEDLIPTVNSPAVSAIARSAARKVVGDERLVTPQPQLVSEDFALILDRVPGALVLLGAGNPDCGASFPHHHPRFQIDERVLPIGVEIALRFVLRYRDAASAVA